MQINIKEKSIQIITFEEIINETLLKKDKIAEQFIDCYQNDKRDYSYYTLIVELKMNHKTKQCYLRFNINNETENGYIDGFNIKLLTFCTENYSEDEINKNLIIKLLEKELNDLKTMTVERR